MRFWLLFYSQFTFSQLFVNQVSDTIISQEYPVRGSILRLRLQRDVYCGSYIRVGKVRVVVREMHNKFFWLSWSHLFESFTVALPVHLSSPPLFSGVRITRSFVLCVCFLDRCLSFCTFSFGHCVVCPSIYGFWLPLWYIQALLGYIICRDR